MKKLILTSSIGLLVACSAQPPHQVEMQDVKLTPPTQDRQGYVRLVKNINYYIDTDSIWVDNEENLKL